MPYVNLPPGCRSLQMEDGKRYVAGRSGGRVEVSAEHAAAIDRLSGNGDAGLVGRAAFHEYGACRSGTESRRGSAAARLLSRLRPTRWSTADCRGVRDA